MIIEVSMLKNRDDIDPSKPLSVRKLVSMVKNHVKSSYNSQKLSPYRKLYLNFTIFFRRNATFQRLRTLYTWSPPAWEAAAASGPPDGDVRPGADQRRWAERKRGMGMNTEVKTSNIRMITHVHLYNSYIYICTYVCNCM